MEIPLVTTLTALKRAVWLLFISCARTKWFPFCSSFSIETWNRKCNLMLTVQGQNGYIKWSQNCVSIKKKYVPDILVLLLETPYHYPHTSCVRLKRAFMLDMSYSDSSLNCTWNNRTSHILTDKYSVCTISIHALLFKNEAKRKRTVPIDKPLRCFLVWETISHSAGMHYVSK